MSPHEVLIDALAEARREEFHLTERDMRRGSPSWAMPTRIGSPPREADQRLPIAGPSLRVRLGHGLLALGAAIAGEDETGRAQRVA